MIRPPGLSDGAQIPAFCRREAGPAVLLWLAVSACYWLYPLWTHGGGPWQLPPVMLLGHAVALFLLLRVVWLRRSETASVPTVWSWRALRSRPGLFLLAFSILLGALQFQRLAEPILSGPDEPVQIQHTLEQTLALIRPAGGVGAAVGMILWWLLAFAASATLLAGRRQCGIRLIAAAAVTLLAGAGLAAASLELAPQWGWHQRWPPVGTLLGVASHTVFGFCETAARLPAMLFFLATGIYLFRIGAGAWSRWQGLIVAVLWGVAPVAFDYGGLAYRESGGAFFVAAGVFYLLRHLQLRSFSDLTMVGVMVAWAYLERRPAVVLLPLAVAVLGLDALAAGQERRRRLRDAAVALAPAVLAVLPWALATRGVRPYGVRLDNLLDVHLVGSYASRLPALLGWPLSVLAGLGVLVAVLPRSETVARVAFLWLAAVYLLFTLDDPAWIPVARFVVLLAAPTAVLATAALRRLGALRPPLGVAAGVLLAVLAAVPLGGWWTCRAVPLLRPANAPCRAAQPTYPFADLASWLGEQTPRLVTVAMPAYWQTALGPYLIMQGIGNVREAVPRPAPGERPAPPDRLEALCRLGGIDYLVVPERLEGARWVPVLTTPDAHRRLLAEDVPGIELERCFERGLYRLQLFTVEPP